MPRLFPVSGRPVAGSALPQIVLLSCSLCVLPLSAQAHGIAGDRVFPATLATDDPAASSEISIPTVDWLPQARDDSGNVPKQTDIGGELDLLVLPHVAIGVADAWTTVQAKNESGASGYQNLEVSGKYQFYENDPHEILLSAGLVAEVGGTGAARVGADRTSTFTPTFYFGKGMGDLPDDMALARPLAVTGTVGFAVAQDRTEADVFQPGLAVEYSMQYLKSAVKDYGLPDIVNHLVPVVELPLNFSVDHGDRSFTGTVDPGIIYLESKWQFGLEALVPLNSATQNGVGVIGQFHIFLDDLKPFAQPLFGGTR